MNNHFFDDLFFYYPEFPLVSPINNCYFTHFFKSWINMFNTLWHRINRKNSTLLKIVLSEDVLTVNEIKTLLRSIKSNQVIQDIYLKLNTIDLETFLLLSQVMISNQNIKHLAIVSQNLDSVAAKQFFTVTKDFKLETLMFVTKSYMEITEDCLKAISDALENNFTLEDFYYTEDPISDEAKRYLLTIKNYTHRNKLIKKCLQYIENIDADFKKMQQWCRDNLILIPNQNIILDELLHPDYVDQSYRFVRGMFHLCNDELSSAIEIFGKNFTIPIFKEVVTQELIPALVCLEMFVNASTAMQQARALWLIYLTQEMLDSSEFRFAWINYHNIDVPIALEFVSSLGAYGKLDVMNLQKQNEISLPSIDELKEFLEAHQSKLQEAIQLVTETIRARCNQKYALPQLGFFSGSTHDQDSDKLDDQSSYNLSTN